MELDLTGFNVRKTQPYNAGILGLPEDVERYVAKAQGLIGFEIFAIIHFYCILNAINFADLFLINLQNRHAYPFFTINQLFLVDVHMTQCISRGHLDL